MSNKKMKKPIMALVLATSLTVQASPAIPALTVQAEEAADVTSLSNYKGDGYAFSGTTQNATLTLTDKNLWADQSVHEFILDNNIQNITVTGSATDLTQMFHQCVNLKSIKFSNFDISKATSMSHMFSGCYSLTEIDLSPLDTSNVTNMESLFYDCKTLEKINLSNINTTKVDQMNLMFSGCTALKTIDLSKLNTAGVNQFQEMFKGDAALTTLDLSSFDMSKASNVTKMLEGCSALTLVKTPAKLGSNTVSLPLTMYNADGTSFTSITTPSTSLYNINPQAIKSISATYTGTLIEGMKPDKSKFVVAATKNNGKTVTQKDFTVSDATASVGDNVYTVTSSGFTTEVAIPGIAKSETKRTLDSITATYNGDNVIEGLKPKKGDFSVTGSYTIYYNNNTTGKTTAPIGEFTIQDKAASVGSNSYTITSGGKSTTVNVTGIKKSETSRTIKSIEATYKGSDVVEGLKPSKDDVTVKAKYTVNYNNGTSGEVTVPVDAKDFTASDNKAVIGSNTYTVTHSGKTDTFTVTGVKKSETKRTNDSIEAEYNGILIEGQKPASSDIDVTLNQTIYYNNGTTEKTSSDVTDFTVSGDKAKVGSNSYTVRYNPSDETDLNCTLQITAKEKTIINKTLSSIKAVFNKIGGVIEGLIPSKDDFGVTATYDVEYDNGETTKTTEDVTDFTVNGDKAVVGDNKYTVSYKDKTSDVNVTGVAKSETSRTIKSIEATYKGSDVVEGLKPSKDDVTVKAKYTVNYNNGTSGEVTVPVDAKDFTVSDNKAVIGSNTYTVTHSGKTDTFTVTGVKKTETGRVLLSLDISYIGGKLLEGLTPSKTDFDVKGNYTVSYDNGTEETIQAPLSDFTVSDNKAKVGDNTYTITSSGITGKVIVNGTAKSETMRTLDSINAAYNGRLIEGLMPKDHDFTVVKNETIYYDNGTSKKNSKVVTNFTVIGDKATLGENTYTVSYTANNQTATADVTINAVEKTLINKTLSSIKSIYNNITGVIIEGLFPSKDDFDVTATYKLQYDNGDEETKDEKVKADSVEGSKAVVGSNKYTVGYKDKKTDVDVTGVAKKEVKRIQNGIEAVYKGSPIVEGLMPDAKDFNIALIETVFYDNGTEETVKTPVANGFTISGTVEKNKDNPFTVEYNKMTATAKVPGKEKTEERRVLKSISATYGGTVVEGMMPESKKFDVEMTDIVYYDNNTTEDQTSKLKDGYTIAGNDAVVGDNTYQVLYNGKSCDVVIVGVPISITKTTLEKINVTCDVKEQTEDIPLQKSDITVYPVYVDHYNNGTKTERTGDVVKNFTVAPESLNVKLGENVFAVSYAEYGNTVEGFFTVKGIAAVLTDSVQTGIAASYKGDPVQEGLVPESKDFIVKPVYKDTYNNGKTVERLGEALKTTEFTVNQDTVKVGDNSYTVKTKDYETNCNVPGKKKSIVGMKVEGIKAEYIGEDIPEGNLPDQKNIKVTVTYKVTYDNRTEETVTEEVENFILTGDKAKAGDNIYTVSVNGETDEVHVKAYTVGKSPKTGFVEERKPYIWLVIAGIIADLLAIIKLDKKKEETDD